MIELISEMFSYTFMTRAFVSGLLLSLCASLLGTPLVLKRYSMIGDGLSHIGFGALAVAAVMNLTPLYVAIPVVSVAAVLLLRLSENSSLKGDSAVALISTASLAIGVIAVSVGSGINIDLNSYLFGSILSMSQTDLYASIAISAVVLLLFTVFYNRIFCVTFDESFARASGVRAGAYNVLAARRAYHRRRHEAYGCDAHFGSDNIPVGYLYAPFSQLQGSGDIVGRGFRSLLYGGDICFICMGYPAGSVDSGDQSCGAADFLGRFILQKRILLKAFRQTPRYRRRPFLTYCLHIGLLTKNGVCGRLTVYFCVGRITLKCVVFPADRTCASRLNFFVKVYRSLPDLTAQ